MARFYNSILGDIRGSLGNLVFYSRRGKQFVRSKGPSTRDNNSPLQLKQQARFGLALKFVRQMSEVFNLTYRDYKKHMTASNYAVQHILRDAITGTYPNYTIDYSKVMTSSGSVKTGSPVVTAAAGMLTWKWNYDPWQCGNGQDRTLVVAYCPEDGECLYVAYGATRQMGEATLNVQAFAGKTVVTWMAFIPADVRKFSNSLFTGEFALGARDKLIPMKNRRKTVSTGT